MPIITIASTKGGVGKSTLTSNLITQMSAMGHKVVCIDADLQNSLFKWNKIRELMIKQGQQLSSVFMVSTQGEALITIAQERSAQGDYVFIDSAGVDDPNTRTALVKADYILTVSPPTAVDLWELDTMLKLVRSLEQKVNRTIPLLLAFNRVSTNKNSKTIQDALTFLDESRLFFSYVFESVIKDRISFQYAFREGKSITEYTPIDQSARTEIHQLCNELIAYLNQTNA
jgi:chromosome partitioning protein